MVECQSCGRSFSQLSQHWRLSDCSRPRISSRQWDILTGLMLGDARLVSKQGRNPYISVSNTKKELLKWFDDKMGVLATGVREHSEPEEEHHNQAYTCSTRTHPSFEVFEDWYEDSVKKPPVVELTPMIAKCWYVSDGTILTPDHARPTARLTSRKPDDVKDKMKKMVEDAGFTVKWSSTQLFFKADETEKFLNWMGEPLPGFNYKFPEPPELENTYSEPSVRQWTDKEKFRKLRYDKSKSYESMAEEWDCSTATVHRWDRKHGFV